MTLNHLLLTFVFMLSYKNQKVLIMGLGLLGGGISATKWFVKHKARVTVTDLKTKKELQDSIKALGKIAKKVKFVLAGHREEDFRENDIIVVNPGVPKQSHFLKIAKESKKLLVNEALIFFDNVKNPILAITGTKGKTTTTNWLAHFLKARWQDVKTTGNSSDTPFLSFLDNISKKPKIPIVAELSSWHLEFLNQSNRASEIAIITNLYEDHLNRYSSMEEYANAKAIIFKNQNKKHFLILNYENPWTKFFLAKKPQSQIYFFSLKPLPKNTQGIFTENGICFRHNDNLTKIISKKIFEKDIIPLSEHNVLNLLAAMLAAHLQGVSWTAIKSRIKSLPSIRFREEIILNKTGLKIINDSAATSPDAGIAALRRFAKNYKDFRSILITGGTDKELSYKDWAREVKKTITSQDLFLLDGSATKKMAQELATPGFSDFCILDSLEKILIKIRESIASENKKILILFSPSSASFEKFKNEFDRGEKFNAICKKIF